MAGAGAELSVAAAQAIVNKPIRPLKNFSAGFHLRVVDPERNDPVVCVARPRGGIGWCP